MRSLEIDPGSQILSVTQTDRGLIVCQTGYAPTGEVLDDGAPIWGQVGWASRPMPPTSDGKAAEAVGLTNDDDPAVIGTRDLRKPVPALNPGDAAVYATQPAASAKAVWTENALTLEVRKDNTGALVRILLSTDGTAKIQVGSTNVEVSETSAKIQVGSTVVEVSGSEVSLAGGADLVALATKVDAAFTALQATLASGANSGGPVAFTVPFTPASVAALKTRAT